MADQFHEYITNEKNLNLEIASEYLLMATWLAYLKSKLLLPGTPEEEFKVQEVAEKLKLQLKKLELIRLLSEQMLKRNRLGREIRTRGMKGGIRSIYSSEYNVSLFELLKAYSTVVMTKDFQTMSIPKLPVFTTEDGIKTIKQFLGKLMDWKNINDLIPKNFKSGSKYKRTGKAGIFAARTPGGPRGPRSPPHPGAGAGPRGRDHPRPGAGSAWPSSPRRGRRRSPSPRRAAPRRPAGSRRGPRRPGP